MRPTSTALVTILAGLVYFADVFFGHSTALASGIWFQLGIFVAVAAVTAYIASRVSVMGAEREALAAEVRQVRLEASDVLQNLRTGVITVDHDGKLLYCNPAAEELLGVRSDDWQERPIMPEIAHIAPEFWAALTATARRGVRLMRVEATVHRPDRSFPVGVTTTTFFASCTSSALAAWCEYNSRIPLAPYASAKALVTQAGMGRNLASRAGICRAAVSTSSWR